MMFRMINCALCFLIFYTPASFALPKGMSFIGLTDIGWQGYIVKGDGKPVAIDQTQNIRQLSWSPANNRAVYIDSAGSLIEQDTQSGIEHVLVESDNPNAYTQMKLSEKGKELWAVELVDGQSRQTRLVRFNDRQKQFQKWHQQPGAIFDVTPVRGGLIYTHVSCVVGCDGIRQELWQRNENGYAGQLTRFNAILRYPAAATDGTIWFSLNQGGAYHLWRQDKEGKLTQLTDEPASDLWVSFEAGDEGAAYFIRRDEMGGRLMQLREGEAVEIPLHNILDIRDLEITE